MSHYYRRKIRSAPKASAMVINIAVDAANVYVQSSRLDSGTGLYMANNDTSTRPRSAGMNDGDGMVTPMSDVAFNVFPIQALGEKGDVIRIVGIELSDGTNVFGKWGLPKQRRVNPSYQWVGTAMTQGGKNYQLKLAVSTRGAPVKYVTWAPGV
jgi:hypothetical protein